MIHQIKYKVIGILTEIFNLNKKLPELPLYLKVLKNLLTNAISL